MLGEVDARHLGRRRLTAEFDRNLGRAGSHVKYWILSIPNGEEIGRENAIHGAMIHGVVIARLFNRVHYFGFKGARKHEDCLSMKFGELVPGSRSATGSCRVPRFARSARKLSSNSARRA